mgnify:FL=1
MMRVGRPPNNQVVKKVDPQKIRSAGNLPCQFPVGITGSRVSRWMIMNQNKAIRLMENHRVKDISWVRNCFIQASFGENQ